MAKEHGTSSEPGGRQGERSHVCLRHPCYYCLIEQGRPIPSELLIGERRAAPRRAESGLASRWHDLTPAARRLVSDLVSQLIAPAPAVAPPACLRALDREPAEHVARFVLSPAGMVRSCDPLCEHLLIAPATEQVGRHVAAILPPHAAALALAATRSVAARHQQSQRMRYSLMIAGRLTWYESRFEPDGADVLSNVFRIAAPARYLREEVCCGRHDHCSRCVEEASALARTGVRS